MLKSGPTNGCLGSSTQRKASTMSPIQLLPGTESSSAKLKKVFEIQVERPRRFCPVVPLKNGTHGRERKRSSAKRATSALWLLIEKRKPTLTVLAMPQTKTHLYEIPLSRQAVAEIEQLRAVVSKLHPGSEWMFPVDSESGHIERWGEPKKRLS